MSEQLERAQALLETAKSEPAAVDLDVVDDLLGADGNTVRNVTLKALVAVAAEEPDRVASMSERVIDALDDPFPVASSMAAMVLSVVAMSRPEVVRPAVPALIEMLDDETPLFRFRAVGAIAAVSDSHPEALVEHADELVDVLVGGPKIDPQTDVTVTDSQAGPVNGPSSIRENTFARQQQKQQFRSQSARGVTATVLVEVVKVDPSVCARRIADLASLTSDDSVPVRGSILEVIAHVAEDDPDAVQGTTDALLDRLDDDVEFVRMWAIRALAAADATEAIDPLREVTESDPDEDVAELAASTVDSLVDTA